MHADDNPAFAIERPAAQTHAAVFSSPHSGCEYDAAFIGQSVLDAEVLRSSEDCHVDALFSGVSALGCPLLRARFPRAYLDVNREPYELDPDMFEDALPHFVNASSHRVAGGLGTVPRVVAENRAIYRRKLRWAEAHDRIERFYFPYHKALTGLVQQTEERCGSVLLVDCHSMPSSAVLHVTPRFARRPDFVIGDRYGATCDSQVSEFLLELFARYGFHAVRNKPYAGGYITQTYGRSGHSKQALQIEVNRGLYMNERTLERRRDFSALRSALSRLLDDFLCGLGGSAAEQPIAAE